MAASRPQTNAVAWRRRQRQWTQAELARRAEIPRTTISAIEGERLTPSVTGALALARALECSVEELFGCNSAGLCLEPEWAWTPLVEPCRYWEAEVGRRRLLFPAEGGSLSMTPHDGVWRGGHGRDAAPELAEATLTVACCDPAVGLLATEFARASGFRLIAFQRGGAEAIDLLRKGLVHVAGLHRSTAAEPNRNLETVRARLGEGFRLIRIANWREGLALSPGAAGRSVSVAARKVRRWALREAGSAARECLEELVADAPGRTVLSHAAVAEAVRSGWADAGVCIQLSAEDAGLKFLPLREENLDFCFAAKMQHDPRIEALTRLLQSRSYRKLIEDLPGYDTRQMGETLAA